MEFEFIKTENRDGVLTITMHDPPTRNALGPDMVREIVDTLDQFERDPEQRVLLLTGTEPSFCSGANVRRFSQNIQEREQQAAEPEPLPWGKMEARFAQREPASPHGAPQLVLRLHELQKPSIAAVNGHAVGAGCGLALACDIRIAAEKAQFSEAFVLRGLIPRRRELLAIAPPHRLQQRPDVAVHRRPHRRQRGLPYGSGQQGLSRQ